MNKKSIYKSNLFRTVIFLDIDGVLQPGISQKRFSHDLDKLRERLAIQFKDEKYLSMDKYDLGAVYYDWDKDAVQRLTKLCSAASAEIVISSDWRVYSPIETIIDYFRLHGLNDYIIDITPKLPEAQRDDEIAEYLNKHQDVKKFVILDDGYIKAFEKRYPDQFVHCDYIFDELSYKKAKKILLGASVAKQKNLSALYG